MTIEVKQCSEIVQVSREYVVYRENGSSVGIEYGRDADILLFSASILGHCLKKSTLTCIEFS